MEDGYEAGDPRVLAFLDSIALDPIEVKFCERFDGQSRIWNFDRHAHDCFEFLFFLDGSAHIKAGGEEWDVSIFDLVIYPPGVPHEERLKVGLRQEIYCMWIELGSSAPFDRGLRVRDANGELRTIMDSLYREYVGRRAGASEILAAYARTLLLLVRRSLREPAKKDDNLVERSLGYIHEHYTEDFDVDALSRAVYVSPSYLFRSFKKKVGMTPMHYRNAIRIEKAKLLLCESDRRLDLIADEVGFSDVKYFSTLFRKLTGLSPGSFRKAVKTS